MCLHFLGGQYIVQDAGSLLSVERSCQEVSAETVARFKYVEDLSNLPWYCTRGGKSLALQRRTKRITAPHAHLSANRLHGPRSYSRGVHYAQHPRPLPEYLSEPRRHLLPTVSTTLRGAERTRNLEERGTVEEDIALLEPAWGRDGQHLTAAAAVAAQVEKSATISWRREGVNSVP